MNRCSETMVPTPGLRFHYHRCTRDGVVRREGKWYCWQHDPFRKKKELDRKRAEADRAYEQRVALHRRQNACVAACEGLANPAALPEAIAVLRELLDSQPRYMLPEVGLRELHDRARAALDRLDGK